MRTALVVLMLSAPAVWASPPTTKTVAAKKSPAPAKAEPAKPPEAPKVVERHVETRRADGARSTLTLAPKKKPARRVLLADWAP